MAMLRRYVIFETLKIFLVTIAVTLLLMVLGGGAKEGLKQGLPPQLVAQILPYMVPEMLRFTIPGCLLFAVCSVFGRMTAANEITAIKALGINPLAVIWPVLILAYGLSIVTFADVRRLRGLVASELAADGRRLGGPRGLRIPAGQRLVSIAGHLDCRQGVSKAIACSSP